MCSRHPTTRGEDRRAIGSQRAYEMRVSRSSHHYRDVIWISVVMAVGFSAPLFQFSLHQSGGGAEHKDLSGPSVQMERASA